MKRYLVAGRRCLAVLSLVGLVASACGAPSESPNVDQAEVAAVKSEIGAVLCQGSINHGGSPGPQTLSATIACPLAPGFHRMTARASNVGAGSCGVASWTNPTNVRDASFNLYINNDGGWSWGTCSFFATEDSDPPAHSLCDGSPRSAPLLAVSSPCVAKICAQDNFCCTSAWDSICVSEVKSVCQSLICPQNTGCAHAECSTGAPLATNCSPAVSLVCAHDSRCCSTTWDSACVTLMTTYGIASCDS